MHFSSRSYGSVADAGADILWSEGIGTLLKWVDDHFFTHILTEHLAKYNEQREIWSNNMQTHSGSRIDSDRKRYRGTSLPKDQSEELSKLLIRVKCWSHSTSQPHFGQQSRPSGSIDILYAASNKPVVQHL